MKTLLVRIKDLKEKFSNQYFIKTLLRRRSYKKAVKSAEHLKRMYGKKYVVIFWKKEFKAVPKQMLKQMWHNGAFKKGLNFRGIEKLTVYSTN
jgi:hypothetical protein